MAPIARALADPDCRLDTLVLVHAVSFFDGIHPGGAPSLRKFSYFSRFENAIPMACTEFVKGLQNLKCLDLNGHMDQDAAIRAIRYHAKTLESLTISLSRMTSIYGEIARILLKENKLKHLSLSRVMRGTSLQTLIQALRANTCQLRKLSIHGDVSLSGIRQAIPRSLLQSVNVVGRGIQPHESALCLAISSKWFHVLEVLLSAGHSIRTGSLSLAPISSRRMQRMRGSRGRAVHRARMPFGSRSL